MKVFNSKMNYALQIACLALFASSARAEKIVKLESCEPLKPKLELIKEAVDNSTDWELKLTDTKAKRTKLNNACAAYQADPTAPKLQEFRTSRDEYGSAYRAFSEKTLILKKKLADSKNGLKFLKDKTPCKDDIKKGEDSVKSESDSEALAGRSVCQIQGVQARR